MAGFTVIPLLMVFYYGLTDRSGAFTLANILAIGSSEHLKALWLSLLLAGVSTVICLVLAYPLALILRKRHIGKGSFVVFIFILPMWMNFLLRTMAWQTLLEKNGVINTFLTLLHLPNVAIINTPAAIILGMVYNFLPFMVLPIYNTLVKIDDNVINAARDLGADNYQTLTKILIPLSVPGIAHDGVCPGAHDVRYFKPPGRQQDPAHRKRHRAGIYKGKQLEPRCRTFHGAHDLHPSQHDHDRKVR